jgi:hypothetical protein
MWNQIVTLATNIPPTPGYQKDWPPQAPIKNTIAHQWILHSRKKYS